MRFYTQSPLLRRGSSRPVDVRVHPRCRRPRVRVAESRCSAEPFLAYVGPYRDDLVVASNACSRGTGWPICAQREGIAFVLGHALYMRAIHGGKAKNDRIDATRSPPCCAAACSRRPTSIPRDARDARSARRRMHLMHHRAELWPISRTRRASTTCRHSGLSFAKPPRRCGRPSHFRREVPAELSSAIWR